MNVEEYGDRKAWGSNNSNEKGHLWKLTPVVLETGNVLLIENHEYGQSLKLDAHVDSYGDRLLLRSRDVPDSEHGPEELQLVL